MSHSFDVSARIWILYCRSRVVVNATLDINEGRKQMLSHFSAFTEDVNSSKRVWMLIERRFSCFAVGNPDLVGSGVLKQKSYGFG